MRAAAAVLVLLTLGQAPAPRCPGAESHRVTTADGASVALHRHPGPGAPVLVVHGISSNHRCWDLSPERSLAVALADAGFDAWLLDLRGHGDARLDGAGRRQWGGWSMDDYALQDVPAAVAHILSTTGATQLAYVGHSMGGMIGAAWASTAPGAQQQLRALVAVGSPMDFTDPDPLVAGALTLSRAPLPVIVPTDRLARVQAAASPGRTPVDRFVDAMLFNDVSGPARAEMYRAIVSPMTGGELRQLGLAEQTGTFGDQAGERDYRAALAAVSAPTLVIAGRADLVAPVDRVLAYYQSSGAERKELVIAGRYTGFAVDYGHLDLTLGDHAAAELFPRILAWLTPGA